MFQHHIPRLDMLLQHVCPYCATMLNKFATFKDKCERATHLLEMLLAEHMQVKNAAIILEKHVKKKIVM